MPCGVCICGCCTSSCVRDVCARLQFGSCMAPNRLRVSLQQTIHYGQLPPPLLIPLPSLLIPPPPRRAFYMVHVTKGWHDRTSEEVNSLWRGHILVCKPGMYQQCPCPMHTCSYLLAGWAARGRLTAHKTSKLTPGAVAAMELIRSLMVLHRCVCSSMMAQVCVLEHDGTGVCARA